MKRDPFLPSLRVEVDRLFDALVHTAWSGQETCWNPPLDVTEDPDLYRLEMDLPGVRAADLTITTQGSLLRIEGTRHRVRRTVTERQHLVERVCGRFVRTFHLAPDVDRDQIRVQLTDGVLTVELPRTHRRSHR